VQILCVPARLESESLIEVAAEALIPAGDAFPTAERSFSFHRKLNGALVRGVQIGRRLSEFKRARCVAALEVEPGHTLEEVRSQRGHPALFRPRPERIDARKRLAAEQSERAFENRELLVSRRHFCVAAKAIELVNIDLQLVAVERIRIAVALEAVAEQFSRLAHRLVEARCAATWVVAWPERFEKLVAASRTALRREVGDEFCGCLPSWLFLLAACELERPEEEYTRQVVTIVARYPDRCQRHVRDASLQHLGAYGLQLGLVLCRKSEHGWCKRGGMYAPVLSCARRPISPCERVT
jgi:hypothetical protein